MRSPANNTPASGTTTTMSFVVWPPAQVAQLDHPIVEGEGGITREGVVGRGDHHLIEEGGMVRKPLLRLPAHALPAPAQGLGAALMPPDGNRGERAVPKGVVPVMMGVYDPAHRVGGDAPQGVEQLLGLPMVGAGIHQ